MTMSNIVVRHCYVVVLQERKNAIVRHHCGVVLQEQKNNNK
jgi:hypothetical protein